MQKYVPLVFSTTQDERDEFIVQQIEWRERDIYNHELRLESFEEVVKDPNFVWSILPDGTTFRQKIENEIPVIQGRIAELKKLIDVENDLGRVPNETRIESAKKRIEAKRSLQ